MTKLIRVTKKIYEKLHAFAGRMQAREKRPISLNEAIAEMFKQLKNTKKVRTHMNQQKQPELPAEAGKSAQKQPHIRREIF
ncbi:hypothetical protein HY991_01290 [Candidatus Micrarchaeota archaeon]|nr:hypothetical protein [Candidatus Micrarchaeota archaeon]